MKSEEFTEYQESGRVGEWERERERESERARERERERERERKSNNNKEKKSKKRTSRIILKEIKLYDHDLTL